MNRIKLNIQKFGGNYGVSAQVISQDTTNNRSTIRITATSSTYGETHNYDWDAYINGSYNGQASGGLGTQYVYLPYNSSYSVSWDIVVNHNPDGSCGAINISCYHYITDSTNGWSSTSITPPRINRYAVTNSATGSNIEQEFSVNYTKYVDTYKYKVRISIPNVKTLETQDYNTSNTPFTLSQSTINELFDTYGPLATFNLGFRVETWNNEGTSKLSDGNEVIISCMTDSKGRLWINGEYKNATPYIRVNGEWKKTTPHIRINNEWKRGK